MRLPSLYEPLNEYKPFAPHVGIADGPFEYLRMTGVTLPLPFTTRMTVVQLKNGDLFLHSPIAFDSGLARHLQSVGTIRHLVSPNQFHYAHIGEWSRAFRDAVTWASPGARQRARARGIDVEFKMNLDPDAPEQWRDELVASGIRNGSIGIVTWFDFIEEVAPSWFPLGQIGDTPRMRTSVRSAKAWITSLDSPRWANLHGCTSGDPRRQQ
jgi:hypothetical protein